MKCSSFCVLAFAGAAIALPLVFTSAPAIAKSKYECFTDDGYGRKLPCSYGFKVTKRPDGAYDCFTDDGYGRKLPCSYGVKRR